MNLCESPYRYAIYYLPQPNTLLYSLGVEWLGYDLERGVSVMPPLPDEISIDCWSQVTASPRRYGFHATLKPPFRLAKDHSQQELRAALAKFANDCHPFSGSPLTLAHLGRFQALILCEPLDALSQLAANCVTQFDSFRFPPDKAELSQRRHNGLSPRELENLDRWGYPYVLDTWKFHMTLTSSLPDPLSNSVYAHLNTRLQALWTEPLRVDSICLFREPAPGEAFGLVERFPFRS
jgi:putative phosphonate metabolism protein